MKFGKFGTEMTHPRENCALDLISARPQPTVTMGHGTFVPPPSAKSKECAFSPVKECRPALSAEKCAFAQLLKLIYGRPKSQNLIIFEYMIAVGLQNTLEQKFENCPFSPEDENCTSSLVAVARSIVLFLYVT